VLQELDNATGTRMPGNDTNQSMCKYWTVLAEHMYCSIEKVRGWQVGKLTATFQLIKIYMIVFLE